MSMDRIVECVPNFSEGRNPDTVGALVAAIRTVKDVFLLDQEMDHDHHRAVLTFAGSPRGVAEAAFQVTRAATGLIDLRRHQGGHPRIGATDVVPFVPIRGVTMDDCVALAREVGRRIGSELNIPVFLYERAATAPHRTNLEAIRKGGLEGLTARMRDDPAWQPDFGPRAPHPTAGATVVGARAPLIAFNVNLNTGDLETAKAIAKKVRFSGGGLPYVKAIGVELASRRLVQVSMNLTNFEETPIHVAFEAVKAEAEMRGVQVAGSEIVGLVPQQALLHAAQRFLALEQFDPNQVLETRLANAIAQNGSSSERVALTPSGDWATSVTGFLAAVSAGTPTPGGGSVAALAGALAAALGVMGCRIGPPRSSRAVEEPSSPVPEQDVDLARIERRLVELGDKLRQLMQADADAYEHVLRAYRLPKTDQTRADVISAALRAATEVPLETAVLAAETGALLRAVLSRVKSSVATDVKVGLRMAVAAIEGARENVLVNIKSQTNQEVVSQISTKLQAVERSLEELKRL
jgi:glutamate formiminotransferase/glutamate formiminotransferase/formiminotetrahydrofolate cyclodeaminase